MGATSGAGPADPSGAPEFTRFFCDVRATLSFVSRVCFVDRCLFFSLLVVVIEKKEKEKKRITSISKLYSKE
jgi:hypothetical protein